MAITVSILQKNVLMKQPKNVKFSFGSITETSPREVHMTFQERCKNSQGRRKTFSHLHSKSSYGKRFTMHRIMPM
jgi:hypothetical protein